MARPAIREPVSGAQQPERDALAVVGRRDRLAAQARRFLDTYRYPITVWAGSRALTFLAIAMLGWVGRPPGSTSVSAVLVRPLAQWDGFWYTLIADHGYDATVAHGNSSAFFPLKYKS